jgi:isoleucyl-tRNA synthetase
VHTAPGHGREDYDVGLQYGLDAYSPVNDNGVFTDEVGRFAGQFVFKANDDINQTLADKGALLAGPTSTTAIPTAGAANGR